MPFVELSDLLFGISYLLIVLGVVGCNGSGPPRAALHLAWWSWSGHGQDDFARIGWPTLLFLALLTVIAWGADLALSFISSRRSGAGWRSIGVSILGGLVGAILLSSIPVVGTFVGAAVGSISALWLMEYRRARRASVAPATASGAAGSLASAADVGSRIEASARSHRHAATQAVKGYVSGFLLAMAVEFAISVVMLSIFVLAGVPLKESEGHARLALRQRRNRRTTAPSRAGCEPGTVASQSTAARATSTRSACSPT